MSALPMLIAGAGPGGLTAAHALLRRGVPVLVLERQPVLMPVGAGLLVQINAMRMLGALELAGPVVQAGVPVRRGTVDDAGGRLIQGSDIGVFADQLGSPCVAILRSALSEQLASRLPEGALRLGAPIAGVREAGDRVLVTLASGEEVEGRGLVGADGIHSAVRTAVFGPVKLRYSGYTCWRGIAPMLPGWEPGRMFERWGRGRRFGMAPVSGSQIYWFATLNAPAGGADEGDLRAKLLEIYAEFAEPVPTLLGSTPPAAILRNDISDLPEQPRWTLGRVALLGDAAHATTPNLGQGACQAIEDAVHLAAAVAKNTDLPQAFLAYEAARRARATGIVRTSWRFGQISQWENGLARALRDALFRLIPASATEGQVRELYDVQVPE